MLSALQDSFAAGRLQFHGALADLADATRFRSLCERLRRTSWVVYAKPPFGGPEQVLKYLARYTHRVAIANSRITAIDSDSVSFRYHDHARGDRNRVMTLDAVEFLRRFLQHVLPERFVRIRHYGFLANRARNEKLPLCRRLIVRATGQNISSPDLHACLETRGDDHQRCPTCQVGTLRRIQDFGPQPTARLRTSAPWSSRDIMTRPECSARLHHSLVQAAVPLLAPVRAAFLDLPTQSLEDAPSHAACANSRTMPTPKLLQPRPPLRPLEHRFGRSRRSAPHRHSHAGNPSPIDFSLTRRGSVQSTLSDLAAPHRHRPALPRSRPARIDCLTLWLFTRVGCGSQTERFGDV